MPFLYFQTRNVKQWLIDVAKGRIQVTKVVLCVHINVAPPYSHGDPNEISRIEWLVVD